MYISTLIYGPNYDGYAYSYDHYFSGPIIDRLEQRPPGKILNIQHPSWHASAGLLQLSYHICQSCYHSSCPSNNDTRGYRIALRVLNNLVQLARPPQLDKPCTHESLFIVCVRSSWTLCCVLQCPGMVVIQVGSGMEKSSEFRH